MVKLIDLGQEEGLPAFANTPFKDRTIAAIFEGTTVSSFKENHRYLTPFDIYHTEFTFQFTGGKLYL